MRSKFVILTGSSGVGKTSIAQAIEDRQPVDRRGFDSRGQGITVYQGDRIGLPSPEILAGFGPSQGPGGDTQRGFALHWIGQIAPTLHLGPPVLLEAQCRIAFLEEALQRHRILDARIILVECDDRTRELRLHHDRLQPHLANDDMRNWSRFLHAEAVQSGVEILDTTSTPLSWSVARILSYLL